METTMTRQQRVKLLNTDWKRGNIHTYGERHRVSVEAIGIGQVTLVFDFDRKSRAAKLAGVERTIGGDPQADLPGSCEHLSPKAVAESAWIQIFRTYWKSRLLPSCA